MTQHQYHHQGTLHLESGQTINNPVISYHKSSPPDSDDKPVVWICHALTANSDPMAWWPGLVGAGKLFDPAIQPIICANILGSCYGSSGPASDHPETGKPWLLDFPAITIRDIVKGHMLLRKHLGINKIHTIIGGSIGGFQALEWAIIEPDVVENLLVIATGSKATPWAIAINEAERMAIESDQTFDGIHPEGGKAGLAAARAIGLLSYRSYEAYNTTQHELSEEVTDNFKAASYQRYQGRKLTDRFNAYCYYALTKAQDTHNLGRGRGGLTKALQLIRANTLSIGIESDRLFPPREQKSIARGVLRSSYCEITSRFGHDGFLLEYEQIGKAIESFYQKTKPQR